MGCKIKKIVFTKIVLIIFLGSFQNILSQSKKIDEINQSISYWENEYSYEDYISSNDKDLCQSSLGYRGMIRGFTKIGVRKYDVVFFNVVNSEYGRVTIDYSDKPIPSETEYKNFITNQINSLKKDIDTELVQIEKINLKKSLKLKREKERLEFIGKEKDKLTKIRDSITYKIDETVEYIHNLKGTIEILESYLDQSNFEVGGGLDESDDQFFGLKNKMFEKVYINYTDSITKFYYTKIKSLRSASSILKSSSYNDGSYFLKKHNETGGFYKNLGYVFNSEIYRLEREGFNYSYNNGMDRWNQKLQGGWGENGPNTTEAYLWWDDIFDDSSKYSKLINHPYFKEGTFRDPIMIEDKLVDDIELLKEFSIVIKPIFKCFQWVKNDLDDYVKREVKKRGRISIKRFEKFEKKCLNLKMSSTQKVIFDLVLKHTKFKENFKEYNNLFYSSSPDFKENRLEEYFNFYDEIIKISQTNNEVFIIDNLSGMKKINFPIEKLNECLK